MISSQYCVLSGVEIWGGRGPLAPRPPRPPGSSAYAYTLDFKRHCNLGM